MEMLLPFLPALLATTVVGLALGAGRVLRPAVMEHVGVVFGTDDPIVGLLLWMLAIIGLVWMGYEASLRIAAGASGRTAAWILSAMLGSGLSGIVVGESWRARQDGTTGPLGRLACAVIGPAAILDLVRGRRVSARHDLRMACALYLFDSLRHEAAIAAALDDYAEPGERPWMRRAFVRLARHALAFDDLSLHGLRPKAPPVAREILSELALIARKLGCTDPATLADLRLIGGALGLDAASIRILLRTHAGAAWTGGGGRWTHHAQTHRQGGSQWQGRSQWRGGHDKSSRASFGQREAGPRPDANGDPRHAHFAMLGLTPGACASDVKQAWRRMAKRYHPDRFAGTEMTAAERAAVERRMRDVNAAYEALRSAPR